MAEMTLRLHKAGSTYIGQLTTSEEMAKDEPLQPPQTVLIMDNSGSMGQWSQLMLRSIFPQMLEMMGCHPDDPLLVILFSSAASHHHMRVGDLPGFTAGLQGLTKMSGVYHELQTQLDPNNPRVRVLALSDGVVGDQDQTAQAAAAAAALLKPNFQIEARAVRLFTSQLNQPDTRALASVLQLNTESAAMLVDMQKDVPQADMAQTLAQMFGSSHGQAFVLKACSPVLQMQPWDEPKTKIDLRLGRNTFWLAAAPEELSLNGEAVRIQHEEPINQGSMGVILEDRLEFFSSQLKVLKVINTEQAKQQITRIVDYFKNLEASLAPTEELSHLLESGSLKDRSAFLCKTLQRRMRSVTTVLESIANDDRVRALNQAQQADYLRQVMVSKNARGLAKRAEAAGMDFDRTLRQEVLQMCAHLAELDEIDSREHAVSFYSQASTLDGIREVCAMADDNEVFEGLLAVDLLRIFNVVGVPAVAPVSDFPDPMTYRLDELIPGNFISVADLSICELAGGKVKAPGTPTVIVNAIPYFEDLRVQRFLQKYAPSALEYICSIGMRRVLAEVPQTFPYTVCAAVWNLVERLDKDRSELNVMLLRRMLPAYHESLQGRFDYLMPLLEVGQDPEKSYFLSHNGITNMISPIWRLVEEGKTQHMPRILRALYTFEAFQALRRVCKRQDAKFNIEQLDSLLGVDFEARGTPLPEMFSRPTPVHCQTAYLDRSLFAQLCEEKPIANAKYCTLFLPFFSAIRSEKPVAEIRSVSSVSDEMLVKALELDYPLDEFLLYNVVEGFLHQSKQSRVDKDTNTSLRPDLGTRGAGQKMVKEYLLERYSQDYELRLKDMAGEERKKLCEELVSELLATDSMATFNHLLEQGVTRGVISFTIANVNSYGCLELHSALMDKDRQVSRRAEKLKVFYIGEDEEGNSIWNGGNVYRTCTEPLRELLTSLGEHNAWESIREQYCSKVSHVYRGGSSSCNRHGHSNDLPSYFAFGHDSLLSFVEAMTKEAWVEHQKLHSDCCGVTGLLGHAERLLAKQARKGESGGEGEQGKLTTVVAKLREAGA